jgi:hypothetical protein
MGHTKKQNADNAGRPEKGFSKSRFRRKGTGEIHEPNQAAAAEHQIDRWMQNPTIGCLGFIRRGIVAG